MLSQFTTVFINITCGLRSCSHEIGAECPNVFKTYNSHCQSQCKLQHSAVIASYTHARKYRDVNIRSCQSDKPINIKQDQAYEIALDYLINVNYFLPQIPSILSRTSYPLSLQQLYKFRKAVVELNLIYNLYRALCGIMEYLNYPFRYQEFWSTNIVLSPHQTISVKYPPFMIYMQINMLFILNEPNTQFNRLPRDILRYFIIPMIWRDRTTQTRDTNVKFIDTPSRERAV